jgi:hypothetical protein
VGNALSPARVSRVHVVDAAAREAQVIVPDYQLSLAIGKEGQNARLAARLTGWRIDIRSDAVPADKPEGTAAQATRPARAGTAPVSTEPAGTGSASPKPAGTSPEPVSPEPVSPEPVSTEPVSTEPAASAGGRPKAGGVPSSARPLTQASE